MISILVGSVLICSITILRLIAYSKKYHLPESRYTRLLGIFTKEHVAIVYVLITIAHAIFTIWFLKTI